MRMLRHLSLIAALLSAAPAWAQLPPSNILIVNQTPIQGGSAGQCLFINSGTVGAQACGGSGTVTSVSVTTANGISGSVATATTTPAISLTLGAITPTSVNGNTITTGTGTLTLGSVTLNAGAGGTLGSNAFTSTAFAPLASPTFTGTVTIPSGGVFATPASIVLTNATGTAAGLTAGNASVAPAGTLTGTTLASNVVTSSLTALGTITSLTATTINAFTLGGAVSGGGNNLNNVNVGVVTPGTGAFTTVSASTSVTSPLHVGGSGTTQTVTYKTTTGVGASGADHIFLVGNNGATQAMRVYNSGAVSIGGSIDGAKVGQLSMVGVSPAIAVQGSADGTANASALLAVNSTSQSNPGLLANEPGRTTVRWGLTLGNWSEFVDFGSNGMVVGEFANAPLVLGTNNAERWRIAASGELTGTIATDASSTATGALQVAGGGVVKKRFWLPAITASAGLQTAVLCQSSAGEVIADSVACLASAARFKNIHGAVAARRFSNAEFVAKSWSYKREPGSVFPASYYRERVSLIADDVARIDPRLVEYDGEGRVRTIDYNGVVSVMAMRLSELSRQVARLEKQHDRTIR